MNIRLTDSEWSALLTGHSPLLTEGNHIVHLPASWRQNPVNAMAEKGIPALTNDALAEWLHWALGRQAGKRVARIFGKSLRTAKLWLSGGIPAAEYPRVAREILAELDQRQAKARLIRRHLEKIALGETDDGVVATALPAPRASRRPD